MFEDTQAEESTELEEEDTSKENEEDEVDRGDSEEARVDTTSSRRQPDNNVPNDDEDVDEVQILSSTPPKTRTSAATKSQPAAEKDSEKAELFVNLQCKGQKNWSDAGMGPVGFVTPPPATRLTFPVVNPNRVTPSRRSFTVSLVEADGEPKLHVFVDTCNMHSDVDGASAKATNPVREDEVRLASGLHNQREQDATFHEQGSPPECHTPHHQLPDFDVSPDFQLLSPHTVAPEVDHYDNRMETVLPEPDSTPNQTPEVVKRRQMLQFTATLEGQDLADFMALMVRTSRTDGTVGDGVQGCGMPAEARER